MVGRTVCWLLLRHAANEWKLLDTFGPLATHKKANVTLATVFFSVQPDSFFPKSCPCATWMETTFWSGVHGWIRHWCFCMIILAAKKIKKEMFCQQGAWHTLCGMGPIGAHVAHNNRLRGWRETCTFQRISGSHIKWRNNGIVSFKMAGESLNQAQVVGRLQNPILDSGGA